jgi:lipid-A-disaccharide synthase
MDYPDFNLRLAKELKQRGFTVVYFISPQVWAWRTGRIKLIRRVVDHMLVIFPFEESFYREHGVRVDFVGHPLLDELPPPIDEKTLCLERQRYGLEPDDLVLGLMPGSRRSEIDHHLATQLETAAILVKRNPKVRPVLMVAPTLDRDELRARIGDVSFPIQIIKEDPLAMIRLADAILVASGTATLMVGLMEKPMVIMYRMNSITAWLAKRLVTKTKFFGMVNLIADRQVVPELFQEEANPQKLAQELMPFLETPVEKARVVSELAQLRSRLGSKGAMANVARLLEPYFGGPHK